MEDKNSMLYWYPKLLEVGGLPMPRTEIVRLDIDGPEPCPACEGSLPASDVHWDSILKAARKIGYPLFMRTGHMSGKHSWKDACHVPDEASLKDHISRLFTLSSMCGLMGLPVDCLVFRELMPMDGRFTAFYGDMPVNTEYRYFVRDGHVLCRHWYWVKDAIARGTPDKKLPVGWNIMLDEMRDKTTEQDFDIIDRYAMKASARFKGCWSIDFCRALDGRWILIDMAQGKDSWHPEGCRNHEMIKEADS